MRTRWWVLLGCALALQGARAGVPELRGLGAGLVLLAAAAWVYVRWAVSGLSARRAAPRAAFEDDPVEVAVTVENASRWPVLDLEVEDGFGPERAPAKRVSAPRALAAAGAIGLRYRGFCDGLRGPSTLGPLVVRTRDPLGLAEAERPLGGVAPLAVYPRLTPLSALLLPAGQGARLDAGAAARHGLAGPGALLHGLRPYVPGDALRLVHWPRSAALGRLVTKVFDAPEVAEAWIYLDLDRLANRGIGAASTLETGVHAAAAIAAHAIAEGLAVRLVARGRADASVEAGRGEPHLARILDALVRVRADGDTALPSLLAETAGGLPHRGLAVLLLSSLGLDLRDYADMLALLRGREVAVLAVLIDARTFLRVHAEHLERERVAPPLDAVIDALEREGAEVYTIARNDDLGARLRPGAVVPGAGEDARAAGGAGARPTEARRGSLDGAARGPRGTRP